MSNIKSTITSARVYVTTYNLYNVGKQYATADSSFWCTIEEINDDFDAIQSRLKNAEIELKIYNGSDIELMYTDYEDFSHTFYDESCINFELLTRYLKLPHDEQLIMDHLLHCSYNYAPGGIRDAFDKLEEGNLSLFTGDKYDFIAEYAADDIPEHLLNYIDTDRYFDDNFYGYAEIHNQDSDYIVAGLN